MVSAVEKLGGIVIKKKVLGLTLISFGIVAVIAVTLFMVFSKDSSITILDNNGQTIIVADSISQYKENENAAYMDVVLTEAVEVIANTSSCTKEAAKKKLLKGKYTIYTNFDAQISKTLNEVCERYGSQFNVGSAVTNLDGDLLAVSSTAAENDDVNYSLKKSQPCSSFKPLAVYAPAIESKRVNWSTFYIDSPYSQITGIDGNSVDWPANATGVYSYENTTIDKAVTVSLNTVAVKCLSEYGVNNSINFLESNFGINLDYEKNQASSLGENEIIGNIALGSTSQGFSTVDMAGYYQIFANEGVYSSPKAIVKIVDADSNTIYSRSKEHLQVISKETSNIVNELLRNVVTDPEGTGKKASCKNVAVAGKTGTGDKNSDNWFVGVTPEYSCAIWHSQAKENTSPEIFSNVIEQIKHSKRSFPKSEDVTQRVYCQTSGKLAGKNCKTFDMGYYAYGTNVPYCDVHK